MRGFSHQEVNEAAHVAGDSDDELQKVELSNEASSVVAGWLGLDSDEEEEDEEIEPESLVRAPR